MMLSDRHPILLANARIVDPSRDLDIVGDLLIAEGVIREAKKGIGATRHPPTPRQAWSRPGGTSPSVSRSAAAPAIAPATCARV